MFLESITHGSCTSYLEIHALWPPSIMSSCLELYEQYRMSLHLPYPKMHNDSDPQAGALVCMIGADAGSVMRVAVDNEMRAAVGGMFSALYVLIEILFLFIKFWYLDFFYHINH